MAFNSDVVCIRNASQSHRGSECRMVLQRCPELSHRGQAFVSLYQPGIECRLPPGEVVPVGEAAPPSEG